MQSVPGQGAFVKSHIPTLGEGGSSLNRVRSADWQAVERHAAEARRRGRTVTTYVDQETLELVAEYRGSLGECAPKGSLVAAAHARRGQLR